MIVERRTKHLQFVNSGDHMAAKKSAKVETTVRGGVTPAPAPRKKSSGKPKRNKTDTASKGKGTKPILKGSKTREIIPTMPSTIVGKQPTGKQLKGEEPMEGVSGDEEEDRRGKAISEATLVGLSKAEIRAIAVSRGYWQPLDRENRSGTRITRVAFLEAQKKDKSLKGEL